MHQLNGLSLDVVGGHQDPRFRKLDEVFGLGFGVEEGFGNFCFVSACNASFFKVWRLAKSASNGQIITSSIEN